VRKLGVSLLALLGFAVVTGCVSAASAYENDNRETQRVAPVTLQKSPLEEYIGLVWGTNISPESRQRLIEANLLRREELIAECMHSAGFEYIPFTERFNLVIFEPTEWYPDDSEWVAEFGFGVLYGSSRAGHAGLPGIFGHPSDVIDPNREIELSLTEAEREAYRRTLSGTPFPWEYDAAGNTISDEGDAYNWHNDPANWGCRHKAWHQAVTESPFGLAENYQFAPLFEAIEEFQSSFTSEITAAQHDWATCMADAGYAEFTVRPNFVQHFQDQLDELTRAGVWFHSWPPTTGDNSAIGEFHQREIATALADLQCRQSVDFDARQIAARLEAETRFVDDHRSDLQALRAAAEQLAGS